MVEEILRESHALRVLSEYACESKAFSNRQVGFDYVKRASFEFYFLDNASPSLAEGVVDSSEYLCRGSYFTKEYSLEKCRSSSKLQSLEQSSSSG